MFGNVFLYLLVLLYVEMFLYCVNMILLVVCYFVWLEILFGVGSFCGVAIFVGWVNVILVGCFILLVKRYF